MTLRAVRPSRFFLFIRFKLSAAATAAIVAVAVVPSLAFAAISRTGSSEVALAYLDPGTGSFIIQALVATIAGVAVTLRLYWGKIKAFFGGNAPEVDADDDE